MPRSPFVDTHSFILKKNRTPLLRCRRSLSASNGRKNTSCTEDYDGGDISGINYKYTHLNRKAKKEM